MSRVHCLANASRSLAAVLICLLPQPVAPAISQAIASAAEHQSVGSMPSKRQRPPAWLPLRTGPWGRIPVGHARADGQETVRRSSPSCTPRPDGRAEQASLEASKMLNHCPYLYLA
jgi:hypothetical protein